LEIARGERGREAAGDASRHAAGAEILLVHLGVLGKIPLSSSSKAIENRHAILT
jgi:hypothetical protein